MFYNIKMQPFWFFVPIPKALPTVAKEPGGVYPKGTLRRGIVPANNKLKINELKKFTTY